jgi:hypothetical protein
VTMAEPNAPSTLNGTELSVQEFGDTLLLHHVQIPGDLPSHCDGCGVKFGVRHTLECKRGGLISLQHNEINDELCNLTSKAVAPSAVHVEPMIHSRCTAGETNTAPDPKPPVQHLSLMQSCTIHGIPTKSSHLTQGRNEKRRRSTYSPALSSIITSPPFVVSTDGLIR